MIRLRETIALGIARVLLAVYAAAVVASPAAAQDQALIDNQIARLGQAVADVRTVEAIADRADNAAVRRSLVSRLAAARATSNTVGAVLRSQIALVDARSAELGKPIVGVVETSDIVAQRQVLAARRVTIDSAIKRADLLGTEAQQTADAIFAEQKAELRKALGTREASPVSPVFWEAILKTLPQDLGRIGVFVAMSVANSGHGLRDGQPLFAVLGLVVAGLLAGPARLFFRNAGRRYAIDAVPGHRVRRSGYSVWRLLTGTALPILAALAFVNGLRWSGMIGGRTDLIVAAIVPAVGLGAFTVALAGTMMMRSQTSWRLLPIDDDTARALLPWGWVLAGFSALDPLLQAFNQAVGASAPATLAANMIEAVARIAVVIAVLLVLGRLRATAEAEEPADKDHEIVIRTGTSLASLAAWVVALTSVAALVLGYVNFSLFLTSVTIMWLVIVAGTAYLLMTFVDDIATSVFSRSSRTGKTLARGVGIRASSIDQFGVLLSGVLRIGLALLSLAMLFIPFGSGVSSILERFGDVANGVTIAGVSLSPWLILRAIIILMIGRWLARMFVRWLTERYLPTTEIDQSARNSLAMIARYVTILLALLWGLASLGIGIERISLLLSALSVGIGFGLQAITQNFVSGLILLAERPVKIGDLVRIGDDEGDVKRINVRSTEIELSDHSTVIVPNSELITKSILNKTLGSPLGRVQIQFSVPLGIEPDRIEKIVLASFAAEPAVLDDPAPAVFLDNVAEGRIMFNCIAHTSSPRTTYGARSSALRMILQRLYEERIDVGTVPQRFELAQV